MTTTTNPKCWVNPTPPRREESDTPQKSTDLYQHSAERLNYTPDVGVLA